MASIKFAYKSDFLPEPKEEKHEIVVTEMNDGLVLSYQGYDFVKVSLSSGKPYLTVTDPEAGMIAARFINGRIHHEHENIA